MLTDWLIVRRIAAELDRAVRGARITAAGKLADGRFGLGVRAGTIAIDAFGATPIVVLGPATELERDTGYARAIAATLVGLRIERVRARRGDRVVVFECRAQSRFGVASGYRLVAELVPRFGNVLLLKDETVVAAAKEFADARAGRRRIAIGEAYEPPPLPSAAADGEARLVAALTSLASGDSPESRTAAAAALRSAIPLVPRLVAESLIAEFAPLVRGNEAAIRTRLVARSQAVVDAADGDPSGSGPVFVYRRNGRIAAAHVVPLAQYAELDVATEPALLPLLTEALGGDSIARGERDFTARRDVLRHRIEKRLAYLAAERVTLERERDDASARDALRHAGDLLYAHLHEVPPRATNFRPSTEPELLISLDPDLDPKANAAAYFARYRKAATKLQHVERRLDRLAQDEQAAREIAWELGRAVPETLDDVAESVARLERRAGPQKTPPDRRRKPLDIRLAEDARVYVGRSPVGNADLTFRLARPHDLWFHARATPGAHVILRIDSAREATPHELQRAAALAAAYSQASASEKVPVDYTARKFVRKRPSSAPGLVYYTDAKTIVVNPRDAAPLDAR